MIDAEDEGEGKEPKNRISPEMDSEGTLDTDFLLSAIILLTRLDKNCKEKIAVNEQERSGN